MRVDATQAREQVPDGLPALEFLGSALGRSAIQGRKPSPRLRAGASICPDRS
jgi:hypothetical protein